jgi:membrane-associated phospholipid phosphatase
MKASIPVITREARRVGTGTRGLGRDRGLPEDWSEIPVLRARQGGFAERFAGAFGKFHPIIVFLAAMLAGLAALAGLSIGLGFFVTRVLLHAWGLGASDERVEVWLAAHRTPARTDASLVGSIVAGGVVLPIVVGVIAVACLLLRKWRIAAFVVFALAVESASYRASTLVVHRPRPSVLRLEHLPVNASYPSGHTAAAIAVYAGLVLLLTSRLTNRVVRALAWTIALALPVFVAGSRLYRGMHHPLDIAGGVVIGVGALIVLVFACRAAGSAAESRS